MLEISESREYLLRCNYSPSPFGMMPLLARGLTTQ